MSRVQQAKIKKLKEEIKLLKKRRGSIGVLEKTKFVRIYNSPKKVLAKIEKLLPFNAVIQVCPDCGKVDVAKGHEEKCDPILQEYIREANNYE